MIRGMSRGALVFGPVLMALIAGRPAGGRRDRQEHDRPRRQLRVPGRPRQHARASTATTRPTRRPTTGSRLLAERPEHPRSQGLRPGHRAVPRSSGSAGGTRSRRSPRQTSTAPSSTIYTSTVAKHKASISAGCQFARRTWTAPESLPKSCNYESWSSSTGSSAGIRAQVDRDREGDLRLLPRQGRRHGLRSGRPTATATN